MSVTEDLISFDIIESQKENIQPLPQGRSAKALATAFGAPSSFSHQPTPGATRSLNDAIRQEYELEVQAIADADDPLDIYDRYVKWTLNAYPTAQATSESQLRPLLERATKTFLTTAQYKNDVRYLKLWLMYIRLFSDTPRETYAFLARHNIGDGLALFYEEFAAWLESAGRWAQAEEVYKLGMERDARPAERLLRKFGEFQQRFEQRPQNVDEPSSPALPTVRPALAAKLDPYASSTPGPTDPQAQRLPSACAPASRSGRQKLAVFSDADGSASGPRAGLGDAAKGWDNIGTFAERRKENVIEARPWNGETLKAGKKASVQKMMVFKDQAVSESTSSNTSCKPPRGPVLINPKNGKNELWVVDMLSVCPNENDPREEYCFEELRARHRGWLDQRWEPEHSSIRSEGGVQEPASAGRIEADDSVDALADATQFTLSLDDGADQTLSGATGAKVGRSQKGSRAKKKKTMEIRGETQTIKAILEPPTGPRPKRKKAAEPTMTIHTKAATEDILDIFSQPLRSIGPLGSQHESDGETEYDDDDYTSVGDSTCTGKISGTSSECGEDETGLGTAVVPDTSNLQSASPWSNEQHEEDDLESSHLERALGMSEEAEEDLTELALPEYRQEPQPKFLPIPPDDYEPPDHPYRNAEQAAQNRLPFMTPIVEQTESSFGLPTVREPKDYFASKTPSRRKGQDLTDMSEVLLSSPFQETVDEVDVIREEKPVAKEDASNKQPTRTREPEEPIIKDAQCNPMDDSIRNTILENMQPPLGTYAGYFDHRPATCNKGAEIRRFVKSLSKAPKSASEKASANLPAAPTLQLDGSENTTYTIKRELGKGAFAPVYLACQEPGDSEGGSAPVLAAIKAEDPPSSWEFYIMSLAHRRLELSRPCESLARPQALHLYGDEGYLVESYHEQGTLLDLANLARADGGPGVLDEAVAMFFAVELVRTVDGLHAGGILHGDLKADNCLVRLGAVPDGDGGWSAAYDPSGAHGWAAKGVTLIDFGRGVDMRAFAPGVQFIADWKTTRQDCAEMRELRPWTFQIDYWGLAGVVHVLLFGKWIEDVPETNNHNNNNNNKTRKRREPDNEEEEEEEEEDGGEDDHDHDNDDDRVLPSAAGPGATRRYRLRESLKRYWQTELWAALFDVLMNPLAWAAAEDGGRMPVRRRLAEVRAAMEHWLVENGERKGLRTGLRRLEERLGGGGERRR